MSFINTPKPSFASTVSRFVSANRTAFLIRKSWLLYTAGKPSFNTLQLVSAVFVGLAPGYLGSFMVLKRMALVGDALSHVALPGVALGLLFNFNPLFGAFATLFVGII